MHPTWPLLLMLSWSTSLLWCKLVPCTRYETLLFTEKKLRDVHELHCDFSVYEKNTLASVFKCLVEWKRSLPRPAFFFENFSPSSTLSHTINEKPKIVNLQHKSHWQSWNSWGSLLIVLPLGFTVIRALFRLLIDRIIFKVLSN